MRGGTAHASTWRWLPAVSRRSFEALLRLTGEPQLPCHDLNTAGGLSRSQVAEGIYQMASLRGHS